MTAHPPLAIKVWGDFACFTRPDMKVERVSYDVMTPSAARGVLESIFWKPQFDWRVRQIEVLQPIQRMSILRNELNSTTALRTVQGWAESQGHYVIEDDHTQRHALILRDVAYIIRADIQVRQGVREPEAKFRDQFRRRVERGRCFWRPYLGCREFSAFFAPPTAEDQPIEQSTALGRMLFDMRYEDSDPRTRGSAQPIFFQARLSQGVLHIPSAPYDELLASKESR